MTQAAFECVEMPTLFLKEMERKVQEGRRITKEEGLELLKTEKEEELLAIKHLANAVRKSKFGDVVHFASTLYIHPTTLCELTFPFCSFYANPGWEKAWFSTP